MLGIYSGAWSLVLGSNYDTFWVGPVKYHEVILPRGIKMQASLAEWGIRLAIMARTLLILRMNWYISTQDAGTIAGDISCRAVLSSRGG